MSHLLATSRRANALVVTLIVLVGVGSMLALTSDRLAGTRDLQSFNLARQQASYAAEAVASLVETKLVQSSSDLANLTTSVIEVDIDGNKSIAQRWLQQGLYHEGQLTTKGMWLGDSLVFWRIEPVKIYDRTIADTNNDSRITDDDTLGYNFSNNYQANPNEIVTPSVAWPGTSMTELNPGYYHFRIVSQAYYINPKEWAKQGITIDTAAPWTKPEQAIASAQTQRMVQFKLINLFRYVIFYGATGVTGDIEIHPGGALNVLGAVHTNGALYPGGRTSSYKTGNYTAAATSAATVNLGTSAKKSAITAVDGIFRTRKAGNYWYQNAFNPNPSVQNPFNIPIPHALNGTDLNVSLNGVKLTPNNDSRKDLVGHTEQVRGSKTRKTPIVNTLANIPELAGYPFEHQLIAGRGQPLFQAADGSLTIRPGDFGPPAQPPAKQLYYRNPPGDYTVSTDVTSFPVYSTDMPLFSYNRGSVVNDVSAITPNATTVDPVALGLDGDPDALPTRAKTFLMHTANQQVVQSDGREARGYYLRMSLFGQGNSGTTGLTIRERGAQNTDWRMLRSNGTPYGSAIAPLPVFGTLTGEYSVRSAWVQAMSAYMARNYVVYLGLVNGSPADITAKFFGLELDAMGQMNGIYTTTAQLPALEVEFMNRRDAHGYQLMGYLSTAAAPNYKVDVLSLNKARIQEIIRTPKFVDLVDPDLVALANGTVATSALFNGMIYVHRTPRLSTTRSGGTAIHNPLMPLGYHPLVTPNQVNASTLPYGFTAGLYPMVGSAKRGKLNTSNNTPDRIGDPLQDVWSVYPSKKQVRITNGATTNWGGVQKSGRLKGLTLVTPNQCYVQGDYNTTADPKLKADGGVQYPPCAVYADGVTVLTNLWVDTAPTYTTSPDGNSTTYNVSLVTNNTPSDHENAWDEGSGGTHNVIRLLERGSRTFNFFGSMVVLNRMRYARNYVSGGAGYYGVPTRNYTFNDDLFTTEGQPPFAPWGMQVTRVLSSVNIVNR